MWVKEFAGGHVNLDHVVTLRPFMETGSDWRVVAQLSVAFVDTSGGVPPGYSNPLELVLPGSPFASQADAQVAISELLANGA